MMAVVVLVVSLGLATRPVDAEAGHHTAAEFVNYRQNVPKPCHKALLPGAVNTCPLSAFSFNAVPSEGAAYSPTLAGRDVRWRILTASLAAQCGGYSPYRPPCRIV